MLIKLTKATSLNSVSKQHLTIIPAFSVLYLAVAAFALSRSSLVGSNFRTVPCVIANFVIIIDARVIYAFISVLPNHAENPFFPSIRVRDSCYQPGNFAEKRKPFCPSACLALARNAYPIQFESSLPTSSGRKLSLSV